MTHSQSVQSDTDNSHANDNEPLSPTDLPVLLAEAVAAFKCHAAMALHERDVLALWVAFAHIFDAFEFSPRLFFWSGTPGCGKTTVLEMLECLCPEARLWSDPTLATIFRFIEEHRPTLLLDECDKYMTRELAGLINSGHKRTGTVPRTEKNADGGFEVREFSVWCPLALASKGRNMPADVIDRSIKFVLRRADKGEITEPWSVTEHGKALAALKRKFKGWRSRGFPVVKRGEVEVVQPEWLYGRAWDNWKPLFTIAALADGDWPERVLLAAEKFSDRPLEDRDIAERLLWDIHALFERNEWKFVYSDLLAKELNADETAPWARFEGGFGIDKYWLAKKLKMFDIAPTKGRMPRRASLQGYKKADFMDAWKRYGVGTVEHVGTVAGTL